MKKLVIIWFAGVFLLLVLSACSDDFFSIGERDIHKFVYSEWVQRISVLDYTRKYEDASNTYIITNFQIGDSNYHKSNSTVAYMLNSNMTGEFREYTNNILANTETGTWGIDEIKKIFSYKIGTTNYTLKYELDTIAMSIKFKSYDWDDGTTNGSLFFTMTNSEGLGTNLIIKQLYYECHTNGWNMPEISTNTN